jgi:predicted Zn-dependent protease
LGSITALEAGDRLRALQLGATANALKKGNFYYILTKLLDMYIKAQSVEDARRTADELFALEPENPRLTQDIVQAYQTASSDAEIRSFFDRNLLKYAPKTSAHGNLEFHLALHLNQSGNTAEATRTMKIAKDDFSANPEANQQGLVAVAEFLGAAAKK